MLLQQNFENSVSVLCLVGKFLMSLTAWEPKKMDVIFPQFVPALSSFLFLGEIEHRGLYFYHIVSFPHQLTSSTLPFPFSLCPFCCQASFPASPSWPLSLCLSSFLSLLLLCCICFSLLVLLLSLFSLLSSFVTFSCACLVPAVIELFFFFF